MQPEKRQPLIEKQPFHRFGDRRAAQEAAPAPQRARKRVDSIRDRILGVSEREISERDKFGKMLDDARADLEKAQDDLAAAEEAKDDQKILAARSEVNQLNTLVGRLEKKVESYD